MKNITAIETKICSFVLVISKVISAFLALPWQIKNNRLQQTLNLQ